MSIHPCGKHGVIFILGCDDEQDLEYYDKNKHINNLHQSYKLKHSENKTKKKFLQPRKTIEEKAFIQFENQVYVSTNHINPKKNILTLDIKTCL